MATQPPTRSLWQRWKALKLPWRRKWMVGQDLTGVTFYEHAHNPLSNTRPRRTAVYPRAVHPADVRLAPAWIQWLRHTRAAAPTVPEQLAEEARRAGMLRLAAAADARWAAKEGYLDAPKPVVTRQAEAEVLAVGEGSRLGRREETAVESEGKGRKEKDNPWKREHGAPSEGWKPAAWKPGKVEGR